MPTRSHSRSLGLLVFLGTGAAWGAGFQLDDQSARAMGMSNAVTAQVNDGSALFYNPAGMTRADRVEVQLGAAAEIAHPEFTGGPGGAGSGATTGTTSSLFPAHAYALYNAGDAAFGLGFFSPFGSQNNWPTGFGGRFVSQRASLSAYELNPQGSFEIGHRVRAGLGVDFINTTVSQQRSLGFPGQEGTVGTRTSAWGFGANLGIQVEAIPDRLVIGATYRSAVATGLVGRAHFGNVPSAFTGAYVDSAVSTDLVLPDRISAGIAYSVTPSLKVAVDVVYTSWQRVGSGTLAFADNPALNTFQPRRWHDTFSVHGGVEWECHGLFLRGGLEYDPTPIPADTLGPDVPDGDRVGGSVGAGYRTRHFSADVAYRLIVVTQSTSTLASLPGRYGGLTNVVGLTLGYRL